MNNKLISTICLILSIISIIASIITWPIFCEYKNIPVQFAINYTWVIWFWLPIPIISVIIELINKKKQSFNKNNFTVYIVILLIMFILGSIGLINNF